jgi:tungstate transport system ATP-binding protein
MLYEINQLTRVHQGRTILSIPTLTISSGKIVSLIGPNGAGKTTLLQLLAFLDTPSSGTIAFRSEAVRFVEKSLHPLRQKVVSVDQYPIMFTGSVQKNLEFGLQVRKIDKNERRFLIEEALATVGMLAFMHAEAHKLSGGETKRVALARALVTKPQVLLCDEPTANVDMENREIIESILKRVNEEEQISIIFATHSLSQAQRLSQQTVTLKDGKLSCLSRENVLSATITEQQEERITCRLNNDVQLSLPVGRSVARVDIRIFLDPSQITLHENSQGLAPLHNLLPGKIVKTVLEDKRVKITVNIGVLIDLFLTLPQYAEKPTLIGAPVLLHIPDEAISVE